MRRLALVFLTSFLPIVASAQMPVTPETRSTVAQIVGDIMVNGQAYEYDRQLADTIGPRLTGSDNYVHAVSWSQEKFRALGLANVHTEPFTIPATWEPETPATGRITSPRIQELHIYSLGWSPSTPSGGVKGNVVYLEHLTEAGVNTQKEKLADNIVLIDQKSIGEQSAFSQILKALDELNKFAPKALLLVGGPNGIESATALTFDGSIFHCPVAQVGHEDMDLIKRMLDHGPVALEFSSRIGSARTLRSTMLSQRFPAAIYPTRS